MLIFELAVIGHRTLERNRPWLGPGFSPRDSQENECLICDSQLATALRWARPPDSHECVEFDCDLLSGVGQYSKCDCAPSPRWTAPAPRDRVWV